MGTIHVSLRGVPLHIQSIPTPKYCVYQVGLASVLLRVELAVLIFHDSAIVGVYCASLDNRSDNINHTINISTGESKPVKASDI